MPAWDDNSVDAMTAEQQAIGRVHRAGQEGKVTVTRIVVNGPNGEDMKWFFV